MTDQQPRSVNAKKFGDYAEYVKAEAVVKMNGSAKYVGKFYARIVWFHRGRATTDADNIAKRHIDALRGVVFVDDAAISKCLTHRVDLSESYVLDGTSLGEKELQRLLAMLGDPARKHVVYAEIGESATSQVQLGPVEE